MFEIAGLGFKRHFLSNSFKSSKPLSLNRHLFKKEKCQMVQKISKKVSHIFFNVETRRY